MPLPFDYETTLPVIIGDDEVEWQSYGLPPFEAAANILAGPQYGQGLTAAVLFYLTECWLALKAPLQGLVGVIPIEGSGFISLADVGLSDSLVAVNLDIDLYNPGDGDLIYGQLPIYYFGMCGFAAVGSSGSGVVQTGLGSFQIGITNDFASKYPAQFINHLSNEFPAPRFKTTPNGFWWHLKPGVSAHLTFTSQDTTYFTESFYSVGEADIHQRFNANHPNPWAFGDLDGGLDPPPP